MENTEILKQLMHGHHLEAGELEKAESLVKNLQREIESRKPHNIAFTRINNDSNGNPRYVCHYWEIADDYTTAVKMANKIGGRKFHNRQYGGGIVFQSYNTAQLQKAIIDLKSKR
jgi:hypothetical protein